MGTTIARHNAETALGLAILQFARMYGAQAARDFIASFKVPEAEPLKPISRTAWREAQETYGAPETVIDES